MLLNHREINGNCFFLRWLKSLLQVLHLLHLSLPRRTISCSFGDKPDYVHVYASLYVALLCC